MATMAPGDLLAIYQALDRVQAIIEFGLDGTVVSANENFLRIFGYELDEIVGKHHRIFCDPVYVESDAYAEFWKKLERGEYHAAEFKRLAKDGKEIWLRASYNPVFDTDGKPVRVVKFATDVTASKLQIAEFEGKIRAIERAQAVIEFELDGTVITANENFLHIFGYNLDEVVGKHHRIFCDPGYAESPEYAQFWQKLGRGEYDADEFKRINKDGAEVWLQASYNPIFDMEGRPLKVVKFASDITDEVQQEKPRPAGDVHAGDQDLGRRVVRAHRGYRRFQALRRHHEQGSVQHRRHPCEHAVARHRRRRGRRYRGRESPDQDRQGGRADGVQDDHLGHFAGNRTDHRGAGY